MTCVFFNIFESNKMNNLNKLFEWNQPFNEVTQLHSQLECDYLIVFHVKPVGTQKMSIIVELTIRIDDIGRAIKCICLR